MSADDTQTMDAQHAPVGADEEDVSAEVAALQAEVDEMREEISELRAEKEALRSEASALETELSELRVELSELTEETEGTRNLATTALERLRDLEAQQSAVSNVTELEIALARSDDEIPDDYGVAEQRALVMAHIIDECRGDGGIRIANDTLQRRLEHELEESLAWAQLDRAADALASMAGEAIEHVSDGEGNRLVIHDDSVLPN